MDRGAWQDIVHAVAKSWTGLNDYIHTHTYTHTQLESTLHSEYQIDT